LASGHLREVNHLYIVGRKLVPFFCDCAERTSSFFIFMVELIRLQLVL